MESTTFAPTTEYSSNVTTFPARRRFLFRHRHDLISDQYKAGIISVGSINAGFAILINGLLLITLLSSRELRRPVFYWHIISLSVMGLISGIFIIPFSTNRYHVEKWLHGTEFCQVFAILDYTQLALPGISLTCLQVDRFARLLILKNPMLDMKCSQRNILQYVLVVFPWAFAVLVCIPVIVNGKIDLGAMYARFADQYCFHMLKKQYFLVLLYMTLLGPVTLLSILTIVSAIMLKTKSNWKRLTDAGSDNKELEAARTSIRYMIGASLAFIASWTPFVGVILTVHICLTYRLRKCFPSEIAYLATYACGCVASYLKQLPWFLLPEVRARFHELACNVISGARGTVDRARKFFSNGPLIVEWSAKQSEIMKERDEDYN